MKSTSHLEDYCKTHFLFVWHFLYWIHMALHTLHKYYSFTLTWIIFNFLETWGLNASKFFHHCWACGSCATGFVAFTDISKAHFKNTGLDFQHSPLKLRRAALMCSHHHHRLLSLWRKISPMNSIKLQPPSSKTCSFLSLGWFLFLSGHILYKAGGACILRLLLQ